MKKLFFLVTKATAARGCQGTNYKEKFKLFISNKTKIKKKISPSFMLFIVLFHMIHFHFYRHFLFKHKWYAFTKLINSIITKSMIYFSTRSSQLSLLTILLRYWDCLYICFFYFSLINLMFSLSELCIMFSSFLLNLNIIHC